MALNDTTSVSRQTIRAFFDSREAAEKAMQRLAKIGIPQEHIMITGESDASVPGAATESKGFWESLKDMFLPEEDHAVYSEGLRRGGYVVAARIDETYYDEAVEILEAEGSVDMNEREEQWRSEGWSGFSAGMAAGNADPAASLSKASDTVYNTDKETWASLAATERSSAPILQHMDVIASDGTKMGTVDHMEGAAKIKLAKNTAPDGQHHYVPVAWVDHVDAHVHLNKSSAETRASW